MSHQPSRDRDRHMRRFNLAGQAQRFLAVHTVVGNGFRLVCHRLKAMYYQRCREQSFHAWDWVTCVS